MRSIMVVAIGLAIAACSDNTTGASTTFNATLSSQKEVPPVAVASANGTAACTIASPNVSCTVTIAGLSGAATAAHIHTGNANANGPIRVNLCGAGTAPACPTGTSGTITSGAQAVSGISFDSLRSLLHTYGAYVNVHTAGNAGGEMRGQLFVPAP